MGFSKLKSSGENAARRIDAPFADGEAAMAKEISDGDKNSASEHILDIVAGMFGAFVAVIIGGLQ